MGYVGAATIPELHENAKFIRTTSAVPRESHGRHVAITQETPNY